MPTLISSATRFRKLVRWFEDPAVGAVAGNAKVGNRINIITRWQALEYVTGQNLERRALAVLGCITVVPGAIGAWKREALERWAASPLDTLAEDQDLTISLLRKRAIAVLYDSTAIAWTEAPDTIRWSCQAAVPLGLWYSAVPVEASRRDVAAALRHTRPDRHAAGLAVPVPAVADRAARGYRACLAAAG